MAGVGLIVTAICQTLVRAGRDEQATFVSIAGIIVALMLLVTELSEFFSLVRDVFGI
jgi:stage III sporulation protein AC